MNSGKTPRNTSDWDIINSVVAPKQMSLHEALLSEDPLSNINNNISGKSKNQKTFRLLYATILEVKVVYKKNNDIVDEMEKRLLKYARNNINELKDEN